MYNILLYRPAPLFLPCFGVYGSIVHKLGSKYQGANALFCIVNPPYLLYSVFTLYHIVRLPYILQTAISLINL